VRRLTPALRMLVKALPPCTTSKDCVLYSCLSPHSRLHMEGSMYELRGYDAPCRCPATCSGPNSPTLGS